jgi:plasmid stability protein
MAHSHIGLTFGSFPHHTRENSRSRTTSTGGDCPRPNALAKLRKIGNNFTSQQPFQHQNGFKKLSTNQPSTRPTMSSTITLKNIPDVLYERLKEAAQQHHRSLNSEIIACLERVLMPVQMSSQERLARAREVRQELAPYRFEIVEIDEAIEEGRP